jgi:hypothetical protein
VPKAKAVKEPKEPKAKTPRATKARTSAKGDSKGLEDIESIAKEWEEKSSALDKAKVVQYTFTQSYTKDQAIMHDVFGVGFVSEVIYPNKIMVRFKDFAKKLIMNVSDTAPES